MPALRPRGWFRGAVCHYAATADNRFIVGRAPGLERVSLACGLGGRGFKFTPALGEWVATTVLGSAPVTAGPPRAPAATPSG